MPVFLPDLNSDLFGLIHCPDIAQAVRVYFQKLARRETLALAVNPFVVQIVALKPEEMSGAYPTRQGQGASTITWFFACSIKSHQLCS